MAANTTLAPNNSHILPSTSIVTKADYARNFNKRLVADVKKEELNMVYVYYRTYDNNSTETIRLPNKPTRITMNKKELNKSRQVNNTEGGHGLLWREPEY